MDLAPILVNDLLEEYCPNCGAWVNYLYFDYSAGWCKECSGDQATCTRCGDVLENNHRTTCVTCRQLTWLEKHADELEFLVVVKGYTVAQARIFVTNMVRPICQSCNKPIKGAHSGALFCKRDRKCHKQYNQYRRVLARNPYLTSAEALAIVKG